MWPSQVKRSAERDGTERHVRVVDSVLQGRVARQELHILGVVLYAVENDQGLFATEGHVAWSVSEISGDSGFSGNGILVTGVYV